MTESTPADQATPLQPTFRPTAPVQAVPIQTAPIQTVPIQTVPIHRKRVQVEADDGPLLTGAEELRAGWQRIKAGFVDNPRGSVAEAAAVVEEAAEMLTARLRARQQRIRDSWEANGSGRDTEALRIALLHYQSLFDKMTGE
jgi:predicted acyl esterase